MKKICSWFRKKSVKQRIAICFIAIVLSVFAFFTVKACFTGAADNTSEAGPKLHISIVDMVLLVIAIVVYIFLKIRDKRKHRR